MPGSDYRLLIDADVFDFIRGRPRSAQENILARLRAIADYPSAYYDFTEEDSVGRQLGVHIYMRYAFRFWEDQADMHLKVLEIEDADRGPAPGRFS